MNSSIEMYEWQMDGEKKAHAFFEQYKEAFSACQYDVVFGTKPRVIIHNLKDLHEARTFMKTIFPLWQDALINIFYSCGDGIATYKSDSIDFSIWLKCPVEDFPINTLSPGCEFVPFETSPEYAVVCDKGD